MSKKNLVKKAIDDLIQEGMDFADLTQSALTKVEKLKGVSKTTIKRAKKEYKQEKVVNRHDYQEQNIKRKIYKYLDRRTKATLADLREAMPGILPAKVSEYHRYWTKKQEKVRQKDTVKKPGISPRKLKEMVFTHLDADNSATVESLYKQFPDAKQSSIYSYFSGWKRKQKSADKVKKGGLYEVIFKFLNSKPDSTIEEIKAAFSDVPIKSIEIYHNIWFKELEEKKSNAVSIDDVVQEFIGLDVTSDSKKGIERGDHSEVGGRVAKTNQITNVQVPKKRRGRPPGVSAKGKKTGIIASHASAGEKKSTVKQRVLVKNENRLKSVKTGTNIGNDAKLIQSLKSTIEAHKEIIFELEKEHQYLKEKQSGIMKEMKTMPSDQVIEIREFIVTYLKGLQKD